ncbi:MAG TPA: cytidylate kinase family protein [Burkholderiales bacterium]|jgi:cytidylate kinase|nr:cytidylate kinase family protein [Burkholderiales bacterium]
MPVVAMTREMGSLGKDVAAQLSERIGKPLVHHEIIGLLADKMRLRKSHVVRFLEGKAGIWERMTTDKTSLSIFTADETFRLIESGSIGVLRGWGAAHLLRSVTHVVSVRVCAPLETRVTRMMERLNTDDRNFVESEIRLSEEAHAAITQRHFRLDWQQPENYDLVLNTHRLTIDECVDEIASLLGRPHFQETAESLRTFANLALQMHVRAALRHDTRTAKMNIGIEASEGRVTLTGVLEPGVDENDAIEVANSVKGVVEAESRLRIATMPLYKLDS